MQPRGLRKGPRPHPAVHPLVLHGEDGLGVILLLEGLALEGQVLCGWQGDDIEPLRKFKELRKDTVDMENLQSVFVQVVRKPERKVILKRGVRAEDYFAYCAEVSCEVWGVLASMDSLCGEPVCLWLPDAYKKPDTSTYVQGVETTPDYAGDIPEGFDVITLPAAEYLAFQGEERSSPLNTVLPW